VLRFGVEVRFIEGTVCCHDVVRVCPRPIASIVQGEGGGFLHDLDVVDWVN
jgi:hypothetical protein